MLGLYGREIEKRRREREEEEGRREEEENPGLEISYVMFGTLVLELP